MLWMPHFWLASNAAARPISARFASTGILPRGDFWRECVFPVFGLKWAKNGRKPSKTGQKWPKIAKNQKELKPSFLGKTAFRAPFPARPFDVFWGGFELISGSKIGNCFVNRFNFERRE